VDMRSDNPLAAGAVEGDDEILLDDLAGMIEAARDRAAGAVNTELVMLYWDLGKRLREHVLGGQRAQYGTDTVKRLAIELTQRYGRGYSWQNLFRMAKFAELYPDPQIFSPLARILTWTNITEVLTLDPPVRRDFYLTLCARERWTKRMLRAQIAGKLYERTIAARGSDEGVEAEIAMLRRDSTASRALAFRDPYVLDFLGLPAAHSESDLEQAILDEMQSFLSELGVGFAFVERQKRIVVDGRDYHLDLLFYHRYLRCLVAVELKTRDLEPGDFGQMTLYMRWLQVHERAQGEEPPIGLILCAGKGPEQTALLGLDDGEIRAAIYITEPLRARMQRRLAASARERPRG
jgi:predicted nuclease of restriction endonuclease-like (RecB) superfamily